MTRGDKAARLDVMTAALEHLRRGIELLDEANAPAHIAAHVDLAVHQLAEAVEGGLKTKPSRHIFPDVGTLSPS